jgi:glyoxylase-like metal-dependent hydrolase (beta-lactamase superfamily II)
MALWTEVAGEVFRRRYQPLDVSVCVVRGDDGLLLVDTRSSHREADEVRADLRELGDRPVRWVVNTHAHYDHTFGNARFGPRSDVAARIYGHQRVPAHLDEFERPMLDRWIHEDVDRTEEWREVVITPPTVLVGAALTLDIGGRAVELVHLGRGHTDNDLLVRVPDTGVWLVGDVLEESGPPMYGSGSFPLDWPATVGRLRAGLAGRDLLVPGHGEAVDAAFAATQQAGLQAVADLVRELYDAGVAPADAVAEGGDRWPFPADGMASAVRDGYRQLREASPAGDSST